MTSGGAGRVRIARFTPADARGVVALWERAFPDDRPWNAAGAILRRKRARRDGFLWVARERGRVVGAVMAGWDGQRGWIYHLAVDPERRRRGIGRALVGAAERALGGRGCPKINLQILARNRAVVGFYERLGYVVEERVSMGKALRPP